MIVAHFQKDVELKNQLQNTILNLIMQMHKMTKYHTIYL